MLRVAGRGPAAVGVKLTAMVQLLCAPSVVRVAPAQVSLSMKSAELGGPTLVIITGPLPVLVRVTVWIALVWPRITPPKSSVVALTLRPGPRPFPVSGTRWFVPDPSLTVRVPEASPGVVGAKLTVMAQLEPAAGAGGKLAGNGPQLFACVNPAVVEILLMVRAPLVASVPNPVLLKVTSFELLVPSATLPKPRDVGLRLTIGPTPVPDSATPGELLKASLSTDRTPVRTLPAVGVKVTLMVQLLPTASVAPQPGCACEKSPLAAIPLIAIGAVPMFARATFWALLEVDIGWGAKVSDARRRPVTRAIPVPLPGTNSPVAGASLAITSVPDLSPIALGAKDTVSTQLCSGAMVVQGCTIAKSPVTAILPILIGMKPWLVSPIGSAGLATPTRCWPNASGMGLIASG